MSILITDETLEDTLDKLGAAQPVPAKKTAVATAILKDAAETFLARVGENDPAAWKIGKASSDPKL